MDYMLVPQEQPEDFDLETPPNAETDTTDAWQQYVADCRAVQLPETDLPPDCPALWENNTSGSSSASRSSLASTFSSCWLDQLRDERNQGAT